MINKTDYTHLIPELSDWNNGDGIDVDGWLGCVGNFELAVAFSRLFWPEFAEHDGCVLFADFAPASYSNWLNSCPDNKAAVESLMNHRHIQDFFSLDKVATASQLIYLGKVLKHILSVKLAHDFPYRLFIVQFDEGPLDNLIDYQVTFWQPSNDGEQVK